MPNCPKGNKMSAVSPCLQGDYINRICNQECDRFMRDLVIHNLAIQGLQTDGAHHKQWYLEQILIANGNGAEVAEMSNEIWAKGIAP